MILNLALNTEFLTSSRIFVAVIEASSLWLGPTKTIVSIHMQRLEAKVSTHLLFRTNRPLNVPEAGRHFYEEASI